MVVPLKILITDSSLLDNEQLAEQVAKLEKAGHSIVVDDSFKGYDFITGPNCWLLRPEVAGLFKLAIDNARKVANADQKRADAHSVVKASKRTTGKARKPTKRSVTTKEPAPVEQHPLPSGQQLDFTTDLEADSFGAGG
jgi:hypothetical protein